MGGIAARLTFLQPNFLPVSVKTIVTFSTPHAIPPVSFDASLEKVYSDINGFWASAYEKHDNDMAQVLLISIAGGTADTTVASDYSAITGFTPAANGFTVFTTGIPTLFSPVDHLAMVWCDQLRKRVIRALLDTVDATVPSKARSLDARLAAMKSWLLNGIASPKLPDVASQNRFVEANSVNRVGENIHLTGHLLARHYALDVGSSRAVALWTDMSEDHFSLSACSQAQNGYDCRHVSHLTYSEPTWTGAFASKSSFGKMANMAMGSASILLLEVTEDRDGFYSATPVHYMESKRSLIGRKQP